MIDLIKLGENLPGEKLIIYALSLGLLFILFWVVKALILIIINIITND